jgi:hypothetical protein
MFYEHKKNCMYELIGLYGGEGGGNLYIRRQNTSVQLFKLDVLLTEHRNSYISIIVPRGCAVYFPFVMN